MDGKNVLLASNIVRTSGCNPISSANSRSDSSGRDLRTCATLQYTKKFKLEYE